MDRTKLKNYAPQARRDFIQAVTDRASLHGLSVNGIEPVTEKGDVVIIAGRAFPSSVVPKRKALENRIARNGFEQTMEALAYTWFNRFVAIRFMELHGYFEHGYRVLSNPDTTKSIPEILDRAEHVVLEGLNKEKVVDLKLDGSKEAELYQMLLVAQCNALHSAMPFLFERIDDETELVLPDNPLHSDSVIRKLVNEIEEADWKEVEIIGWLYQFYISDKSEEVIGKVVASADIPAATQLFTPNWIVKYLVQNTLGRQWLATYPQSSLRHQLPYYSEPAEQPPEVQEQLKAITPTSLNPEELTLLDPASGSGHILVEAYDVFKAIYLERGYRAKDIPALILQKNLFGLEIDDRAAQLAAFALMMKARAEDRRIFENEVKPNIVVFEDSQGMSALDITRALNEPMNKEAVPSEYLFEEIEEEKAGLFSKKALAEKGHVSQADIASLLALFENAKAFGSLIQVPPKVAIKLPEIERRLNDVLRHGDLRHAPANVIKPLVQQVRLLARQYDAIVANPPYMGRSYMPSHLKDWITKMYHSSRSDVATAFVEASLPLLRPTGYLSVVIPFMWMFNSSYEAFRERLLAHSSLVSLIQLEYNAFEPACVPVCCLVLSSFSSNERIGDFIRLSAFKGHETQAPKTREAILNPDCEWRFAASSRQFSSLPGSPIVYWLPRQITGLFDSWSRMEEFSTAKVGLQTSNNGRFVRFWYEVALDQIGFGLTPQTRSQTKKKWFPFNKGGLYRKWAGNVEHVVNWESDGHEIKHFTDSSGRLLSRPQNAEWYFLPGITWSDITSSENSFRWLPDGIIPSNVAHTAYFRNVNAAKYALAFVNSSAGIALANAISPTMHFSPGYFGQLPIPREQDDAIVKLTDMAIEMAQKDWDLDETSWMFGNFSIPTGKSLAVSYAQYAKRCSDVHAALRLVECDIENHFRSICGLSVAAIEDIRITLREPNLADDIKRLLSYGIGCLMGRFSLDKPGLIYAHSGNKGFDAGEYKTFRADDDGIIPLLETDWGIRDDAVSRIVEFVDVLWPKEHMEENLKFIADSLGPIDNEQPRDTIRRYLAVGFYKHHVSMYNRRPIYWLFSSGKHRAFQCLVYLHRYNEGTLSRMRTEYVIPLQGKLASRIEQLASNIQKTSATSHRKKLEKERDTRLKQQIELQTFDEKLHHCADLRIKLDLDDGVKVNYIKFGDLLAEVKSVIGEVEE